MAAERARRGLLRAAGIAGIAGAILLLVGRIEGLLQPGPVLTAIGPLLLLASSVGVAADLARDATRAGRVGLAMSVLGSAVSAVGHALIASPAWRSPAIAGLVAGGMLLFVGLSLYGATHLRRARVPARIALAAGVAGLVWFAVLRLYPPATSPDYYLLAREVFGLAWLALCARLVLVSAAVGDRASAAASAPD